MDALPLDRHRPRRTNAPPHHVRPSLHLAPPPRSSPPTTGFSKPLALGRFGGRSVGVGSKKPVGGRRPRTSSELRTDGRTRSRRALRPVGLCGFRASVRPLVRPRPSARLFFHVLSELPSFMIAEAFYGALTVAAPHTSYCKSKYINKIHQKCHYCGIFYH